jgi:hypothetical protein
MRSSFRLDLIEENVNGDSKLLVARLSGMDGHGCKALGAIRSKR